ncbi:MAG: mercury resistance protein [bacterium]
MNGEIQETVAQAEAGHGGAVKGLMGKVMLGAAFLTCPCHLPIYLVLFGGTALGGYLTENMALAAGVLTAAFLFSLLAGIKMVKARK